MDISIQQTQLPATSCNLVPYQMTIKRNIIKYTGAENRMHTYIVVISEISKVCI